MSYCSASTDSYQLKDPSPDPLTEPPYSAPWWADREEHREQGDPLREQLKQMDEHVARLQDVLGRERTKCTRLQLRSNQQEAELRRREQHINRLKERMLLLTERHREKGPSIEVLNPLPGSGGKRGQPIKPFRSTTKREEATLRLMLERREAELREAMKLRHSVTTLLHALRVDMEHTLAEAQDDAKAEDDGLDQAEAALGDHVTGGVVQSWRRVLRRLDGVLSEDKYPVLTGVGTDHDKLLARLETDLNESQQLVRFQQQLLQDSFASAVPSELADSYFLDEWERLRERRLQLDHQRRTFERERRSFTDAAIRLSHERREFEQQKALLLKQQYLCDSPFSSGVQSIGGRESAALHVAPDFSGLGPCSAMSGCLPITPSSTKSETAAGSGFHQGRVKTPSTAELYSALHLSRTSELDDQSETWDDQADGMMSSPLQASHFNFNFNDRW